MNKILIAFALLSANFSCCQQWQDDLSEAVREAGISNKKILLYFSVSESCEPCRALEENVFATAEFQDFVKNRYALVRPEFKESESIETKAEKLIIVEKYNKDGFFPLVVILDRNSRVLGKTGLYNGESPKDYIRILKRISHE